MTTIEPSGLARVRRSPGWRRRVSRVIERSAAASLLVLLTLGLVACGDGGTAGEAPSFASGVTPDDLGNRVEQFAPVTLTFDSTLLDADQKKIVKKLVQASDVLDEIFLRQVSSENPALRGRLAGASGPGMEAARGYFDIMYGPWDRLEHNEPFLAVGPKPPGAAYYPEDLTAEEFQSWLADHPADSVAFTSYYTLIRRRGDSLVAIPYSEEYRGRLQEAAGLLREAAELAENESLARFLRMRAESFLSNEYRESEVAWVELQDNRIAPTIGPYEVYEDNLLGYKAAFESFITVRDPEASQRLQALASHLPALEEALPIPDEHKNLERDFSSPISVVTEVYTAGDTRAGVQTLAFNLPNDPVVREKAGSKKVMLQNVVEAKFRNILRPIALQVMDSAQAQRVGVDPYFTRILMHELAHGIGPDYVTGQPELTVNGALRDRYSAIEEAKADAVGTHSLRVLTERGVYSEDFLRQVYIGHAADLFRCVRFGTSEAHGLGCLTQFNYLREAGALAYDQESGRFRVELDEMPGAIESLAREYLMIEATGDYEAAGQFMEEYGQVPRELEEARERLSAVPVDIRPSYAVKDMMGSW